MKIWKISCIYGYIIYAYIVVYIIYINDNHGCCTIWWNYKSLIFTHPIQHHLGLTMSFFQTGSKLNHHQLVLYHQLYGRGAPYNSVLHHPSTLMQCLDQSIYSSAWLSQQAYIRVFGQILNFYAHIWPIICAITQSSPISRSRFLPWHSGFLSTGGVWLNGPWVLHARLRFHTMNHGAEKDCFAWKKIVWDLYGPFADLLHGAEDLGI